MPSTACSSPFSSLLVCTDTQNPATMSRATSPAPTSPSAAGPYPQAVVVSRVEKSLVWGLAGLRHEAEPVQVGCLCLSLQGQTMAALGQPERKEGLGGPASWRLTQGRGGLAGLFPWAASEPEHAAQVACLRGWLGDESAPPLLSASPLLLERPEESCHSVAGQAG